MSASDLVSSRVNSTMHGVRQSGPRKYEAIVTKNHKHSDGDRIRFYIPELLPLSKGALIDNPVPMARQYRDGRGNTVTANATHNNNMEAIYYSTDSHRKTPPDVQQGERIYVWQVGDTDLWYWEPTNMDSQSMRRSETVIHTVNADKPTGPDSGKHDASNTYYTEVSSQNKTYTISTSAANGEVSTYMIQINAGKGAVVIKDGAGNWIQLETGGSVITLHNACDTEVKLHENHISVKCNETYNEKVGTDKTVDISGNCTVNIGGDCNVSIGGSANISVGGSTTLDCADNTITGNVSIGGTLDVAGATSLGGGGTVQGGMNISGDTSIDGPLSASGSVSFPAGGSSGHISGSGD